jgi:hypothetical protein
VDVDVHGARRGRRVLHEATVVSAAR